MVDFSKGQAPILHCHMESLKDILNFLAHTGYTDLSQFIMSTDTHQPLDPIAHPYWMFESDNEQQPKITFRSGKLEPKIPYLSAWNSKVQHGSYPTYHKVGRLIDERKRDAFIQMKGKGVKFEQYGLVNTVIDSQELFQSGHLPVPGAEKALNAWTKHNN